MNDDKLPMFVIAESNKLRCLKHVKKYFVVAESRRKAGWIHNFLNNGSGRWMIDWKKNWKVTLVVDICTIHVKIGN